MKQYIVPIILVIAIVATSTGYLLGQQRYNGVSPLQLFNKDVAKSKYDVKDAPEQFFGPLSELADQDRAAKLDAQYRADKEAASAVGFGGGIPVEPDGGIGDGAEPLLMPLPPFAPEVYTFEYTGEDFSGLLVQEQPVYLRERLTVRSSSLVRFLQDYSFGLINLGNLERPKLQSLSVTEESGNGYDVYIDNIGQSLSLYKNQDFWIAEEQTVGSDSSVSSEPGALRSPEFSEQPKRPSDEEIIAATNQFLASMNVSLDGYGSPRIDQRYEIAYAEPAGVSEENTRFYPMVLEVVYPYIIDGLEAIEEGGRAAGLYVGYNLQAGEVQSVNDLRLRQYHRSQYKGVTDQTIILQIAEQGGFRNYPYREPGAVETVLELGTPEQKIMRFWRYDPNTYTSEELFIPVLSFPILNPGNYWQTEVLVPLVQEILDQSNMDFPVMPLEPVSLPEEPAA